MSVGYLTAEYHWQKRMRCDGYKKRAWCKHLKRARRRLERTESRRSTYHV